MATEETWQKRYEAMCMSIVKLERRIVELQAVISHLEAEKRQWEQEKVKQQQIIQQALNTSNSTNNGYLEENRLLKEENKRLRGE